MSKNNKSWKEQIGTQIIYVLASFNGCLLKDEVIVENNVTSDNFYLESPFMLTKTMKKA